VSEISDEHADFVASLPDENLAAAPAGSRLAEEYYGAMGAAINFAWVNRQLLTYQTRQVFERVFDRSWEAMEMELLYDVAHNIAKKEVHDVDGEDRELYVHRKGATRAFPAGREEVPRAYREVGQPVLLPGQHGHRQLRAPRWRGIAGRELWLDSSRRGADHEPHAGQTRVRRERCPNRSGRTPNLR